jgi:N-methylhydantoinase A/oxoprolinase/acetone carboxylase beta subunit
MNKFVRQANGIDYSCRMQLNKTIIGIGAPVGTYLPEVAQRLGTKLSLPEHMEVGNAVGAITGSIIETVEILVKPKQGMGVMDDPPCVLHSSDEKREFETLTEAMEYAKKVGTEIVTERAISSGAEGVEVVVENSEMRAKLGRDWGNDVLLEIKVIATAIGKPKQFFEGRGR